MRVQVVDLFSGCGGMSVGFDRAGHRTVKYQINGALDTDRHANATYRTMLGVEPLDFDIRLLSDAKRLDEAKQHWGLEEGLPLVLIGCAPCQGFSSHRKKDQRLDGRNELMSAFADVVAALSPDVVVMENVPEMLGKRHWAHYEAWREKLQKCGYTVRTQIHNLAGFGVPQERFRAVAVAMRHDMFPMPKPTLGPSDFRTVRDAIGGLPPLEAGGQDPSDPMHQTSQHRQSTVELLRLVPADGGSRRDLPPGVGPDCLASVDGFRDVYGRLAWDRPAVAITARCRTPSCGRFAHPEQHRGLSVREAALLQGFPADYVFEGPFDDKFKQIGNAVSPVFAAELARHIGDLLTGVAVPQDDYSSDITGPLLKSFSSSIAGLKRSVRAGMA